MDIVIWLIVGLAIGGAVGALATWYISRARGGAVSVMQMKQENDKFRNEVTEHFVETARLINQMSDSYKQVFDHLSSGAEKLVDHEKLAERLPPASGQELRLSQFGASASAGSAAQGSGKSEARAVEQNRESGNDNDKDAGQDAGKDPEKARGRDTGREAGKDAGKALDGKDPLKSGSGQTDVQASRPAAAESQTDSESGNDVDSGSVASEENDDSRKPGDSAEKNA